MTISNRPEPTQQERILPDDAFICSKTDMRGKILYGNTLFLDYAGYPEESLLGAPHNVIRHPEMPRGVFKALWSTIAAGKEFLGYVKNMSADGSYYWVFATITPDLDRMGQITGYYSVRRRPRKEALAVIEPIYKRMLASEARASGAHAADAGLAVLDQAIKDAGKNDYHAFVLDL